MKKCKVVDVSVKDEYIQFDNGAKLYSYHDQDCCENHYLNFADLQLSDFDGLEFDLSGEEFFKRIEDYGIELIPIDGHSVKIAGHGSNNGYYSSNLSLVIEFGKEKRSYDISECQEIND